MKFSRLLNNICYYRYRGKSIVKKKRVEIQPRKWDLHARQRWLADELYSSGKFRYRARRMSARQIDHLYCSLFIPYLVHASTMDLSSRVSRLNAFHCRWSIVHRAKIFEKRINCLWGRIMRKVRSIVFKFMSHGMSNLIVQRKYLTILLG